MEQITILLDNLTEDERNQLMKLVEKANEPKSKVWKPAKDGEYWCLWCSGAVTRDRYEMPVDVYRWELGNCFPTEEEAEEEATRRKMLVKWKRLSIEAGEEDNPWDGRNLHWAVSWDCEGKCFHYFAYENCKYPISHFPSSDSLKAAIAELGEENVKKYILGVKE